MQLWAFSAGLHERVRVQHSQLNTKRGGSSSKMKGDSFMYSKETRLNLGLPPLPDASFPSLVI